MICAIADLQSLVGCCWWLGIQVSSAVLDGRRPPVRWVAEGGPPLPVASGHGVQQTPAKRPGKACMHGREEPQPEQVLESSRRAGPRAAVALTDLVLGCNQQVVLGVCAQPAQGGHQPARAAVAFSTPFWEARTMGSLSAPIAGE